jgi:type VI secretion system FHA domain protein
VPLVVRVDDLETQESQQYAFLKSPVRVGRSELNDLHLDRPYVSTWHGLVQFEGDKITYVDLGSTNGTVLDGARLEKNVPAEIGPHSELVIGGLRLHLALREAGDAPQAPRKATAFAIRALASQSQISAVQPSEGVKVVRPIPGEGKVGRISGIAPVAQPPAPAVPPAETPGADPAKAALDDASWQLQVLHDGFVEARRTFDEAADAAMARVPEAERPRFRALLGEKFGAGAAPGPAAAAAPPAPAPFAAPTPGDLAAETLGLVRAFAESYLPDGSALEEVAHVRALLEALAEVLETSARSYIELRRGYEEFGKEMGIRVAQGEGPVARARDPRQLLAWLLARHEGGTPRAPELSSAFADLMIHQVALLAGVTEGARGLLARLSPEAISQQLEKGGGGLSLAVKALREGAQWRAYVEAYRELTEEDAALTDVLFGRDFARAYSVVAGRRLSAKGAADKDATPRPERDDSTPKPGPRPGTGVGPGPGRKDR